MNDPISIETIMIFSFAIIIIASVLSIFIYLRKRKSVRSIIPQDLIQSNTSSGLNIPILASYSGLKALAPLTFGHNTLNPKLIFFSDHFDYMVIFRKSAYYSDIAFIRSFRSRHYNRLRFAFKHKAADFTAVFGNETTLLAVLALLGEHGITPDVKSCQ